MDDDNLQPGQGELDVDDKRPSEFAEHDFEGPFELGHAIFDDAYGVYLLVGVIEDEPAKLVVVYVGADTFVGNLLGTLPPDARGISV